MKTHTAILAGAVLALACTAFAQTSPVSRRRLASTRRRSLIFSYENIFHYSKGNSGLRSIFVRRSGDRRRFRHRRTVMTQPFSSHRVGQRLVPMNSAALKITPRDTEIADQWTAIQCIDRSAALRDSPL